MTDPQPRSHHQRKLQILRSMTPSQKLARVFKLNERVLNQMRAELRQQYPDLSEAELHQRYLELRNRCHQSKGCIWCEPQK